MEKIRCQELGAADQRLDRPKLSAPSDRIQTQTKKKVYRIGRCCPPLALATRIEAAKDGDLLRQECRLRPKKETRYEV